MLSQFVSRRDVSKHRKILEDLPRNGPLPASRLAQDEERMSASFATVVAASGGALPSSLRLPLLFLLLLLLGQSHYLFLVTSLRARRGVGHDRRAGQPPETRRFGGAAENWSRDRLYHCLSALKEG